MKTFEQWLLELATTAGAVEGKPQPTAVQKKATIGAKDIAAQALQKQPELTTKLTGGGIPAKQAQAKLSADISADVAKTAGNDVDPTKAAFAGVDDVIGDIENTIDKPSMMKKRMKKK